MMNPPSESRTSAAGDGRRHPRCLSRPSAWWFPAFNEAENIPAGLHIAEVLHKMVSQRWQSILVDDGSRDVTWSVICGLAADDPKVRGVRLSWNFGHE